MWDSAGRGLNVTFHSSTSLTLSWSDSETLRNIVCYSVELISRGRKTQYFRFYQQRKTHKRIDLKGL